LDQSRKPGDLEVLQRFQQAQDRLVLQASDLSLGTICTMVDREAIDLSPVYQRRERWQPNKQSALVESFLLNVPVPPIYLAEDEFGRYSVVDGKQRITAIWRFISNRLVLRNLETFVELEGYRYAELPRELQNALDVRPYLRVITLLKQSDPTLKFEVFTRLNRGGEQMQAQELRNVAFRGPLNDLIYQLADNAFLKQQLKISGEKSRAYQLMQDAEYVLRFLTLRKVWRTFSGDFRNEMDRFMVANADSTPPHLEEYRVATERALAMCEALWGSRAFKRPEGVSWRDQLLAGMFDAEMVAVDRLTEGQRATLMKHSAEVVEETRKLFKDYDFDMAVRQGTNTPSRIIYRINKVYDMLVGAAA
jgi:hypothetical protein